MENNYQINIYILPYQSSSQSIYVFTDNGSKSTSGKCYNTSYLGGNYGSQAVRFTQDGKLIWYSDSGSIRCYVSVEKNPYYFLIKYDQDNATLIKGTGSNQEEALRDAAYNYGLSLTISAGIINSINDIKNESAYERWCIWTLKSNDLIECGSIDDLSYTSCHSYILSYGAGSVNSDDLNKSWYYEDVDGSMQKYVISANVSDSSLGAELSSIGLRTSVTTDVSENQVILYIKIVALPSLDILCDIQTKFKDNSFLTLSSKLEFNNLNIAKVSITANGSSQPTTVLIQEFYGDVLYGQDVIDLTGE